MAINNPFLSPSKKLDLEMQQLQDGSREIEQARARAEVAFRQEETQGRWNNQPLDASNREIDAPPAELPEYWAAGVQFAAAWVLGYGQAAAKTIKGPTHFEELVDHCVSVLAESTYTRRLNLYAKVKYPQMAWVVAHFTRDVRRAVEKPLGDLKLQVWQRYKVQLEASGAPEASPGTEAESTSEKGGSVPAPGPSEITKGLGADSTGSETTCQSISLGTAGAADRRKAVVEPILLMKGWSILDWAGEANVDYNTASDYLNGLTNPHRKTLVRLARVLGMPAKELPL